NHRGVYEEALGHARESIALDSTDAFYHAELAKSLLGLRRLEEAIKASKESIRLSDGKYSWMHFKLGSAYFDARNWQAARQSFEKTAELDSKNDAAAYNIALCFVRLGFKRDAAA